jgi:hypothetical protein
VVKQMALGLQWDPAETWRCTMKIFLSALLAALSLLTSACGGNAMVPNCGVIGVNVTPATMTVNHAAAPPSNGETFSASSQLATSPGCPAVTAALVTSNWTVSDPSVHLSATQGTMVTATCTATLASPVTVTATSADGKMLTGQAMLTCN